MRRNNPIARCDCLFLSAKDFGGQTQRADRSEEIPAIGSLAHGSRGNYPHWQRLHQVKHCSKAREASQSLSHAIRIEPTFVYDTPAKPSHQFFVEQHHWRAWWPAEHDQSDRV
jgi:hypothetical protein